MDVPTLKILTQALDHMQRGLALAESVEYDTSDIQDGVKHLVADIFAAQINPLGVCKPTPATEWITSDHVTKVIDSWLAEEAAEVRQSTNSGSMGA